MKNKLFIILLSIVTVLFLFIIVQITIYRNYQKNNSTYISQNCSDFIKNVECFNKSFEKILPKILLYQAKKGNKNLEFISLDAEKVVFQDKTFERIKFPRLIPKIALNESEALIGYGVDYDISFEENYSTLYNKPSYAFDCGIESIDIKNSQCHFSPECIGTDDYILDFRGQKSSEKIHSFSQKLKELNLENKKIYVKMSIAGAELEVLPDILKYSDQITGIVITFDLSRNNISKIDNILNLLNKNFVLVSRTTLPKLKLVKYCKSNAKNHKYLVLSYINKKSVDRYSILWNQDVKFNLSNYSLHKTENNLKEMEYGDIKFPVVLVEKIKELGFFKI